MSSNAPLDTSKTVVENELERGGYFLNDLHHDSINEVSRITSLNRYQSKKSDQRDDPDEHDLELQSVSSNETINVESPPTEKDFMFSQDADLIFPEGGKEAYLVVFGCFMGLIVCFGTLNITGVIQTYIAENQLKDTKSSTVAWIFSIMLFLNFITSIFSGTYFDRNGSKKLLLAGSTLTVGGLFSAANSYKYWHFILSYSILVGLGGGLAISPLVGCVAHYFNKKRGLMNSLASTGGSVGGIVLPIMLRNLYPKVGYAWAMRIYAFIALFCFAFAYLFAKERLPPKKVEFKSRRENVLSYLSAVDIKGLKDGKFLFVVFGCAFAEAAALIVSTYHASYARAQGYSLATSYTLISVSHAGGIPGRWLTGFLADKLGRFNVMMFTLTLSGIIIYITLLPFGSHIEALYVFSVMWGFSTGSIFSLLPVCCGQISKTEDFGRRYGTMYCIVALGTLVCIPITGAIIGDGDLTGYRNFVIYAGLNAFGSGIFYTISKSFCVGLNRLFSSKF